MHTWPPLFSLTHAFAHRIRKQPRKRYRLATLSDDRGCWEGASLTRADKLFGPSQLVAPQWSGTWQDLPGSRTACAPPPSLQRITFISHPRVSASIPRVRVCPSPLASGTWRNCVTMATCELAEGLSEPGSLWFVCHFLSDIFQKIIRYARGLASSWRRGEDQERRSNI